MRKTLNIIGCGNVGRTLGRLWTSTGPFIVQDVLNRTHQSAQQAVSFIGAGHAVDHYSELRPADIYMVGTNDDQIALCVQALAQSVKIAPGTIIFHCSGARRSSELKSLVPPDAFVASVHPIRSFAAPEKVAENFSGTYCGTEGDAQALAILADGFSGIGAKIVQLDADFKVIYHSAAVFACNYLVTLLDVAQQAYVKAGIPEDVALKLMEPLVKETVENVFRIGPEHALSGPIARGDVGTVVKQYRAVADWDKRFGALYKLMGKLTKGLAVRRSHRTDEG